MYKRSTAEAFKRKFNHLSKLCTMKVTFFKVLALFAVFSPLTAITGKCKARKPTERSFSDEQEAAIARLKLLMEKLSSIKRSYPAMYAEKRGKLSTF